MNEQEISERIKAKYKEARTAGKIHRQDLMREIRRLEKELKTYRYYQENYKKGKRVSA